MKSLGLTIATTNLHAKRNFRANSRNVAYRAVLKGVLHFFLRDSGSFYV